MPSDALVTVHTSFSSCTIDIKLLYIEGCLVMIEDVNLYILSYKLPNTVVYFGYNDRWLSVVDEENELSFIIISSEETTKNQGSLLHEP